MHPFQEAIDALQYPLVLQSIARRSVSMYGREHVEQLRPSSVFGEVRDELDRVQELRTLVDADDAPPLEQLPDIRAALHRAGIAASAVSGEDSRAILLTLQCSRALHAFFQKRSDRCLLLSALAAQLYTDKVLEYQIDRVIDEEGGVKDGASRELRTIRRELIEKGGSLRRRMEGILKRVSQEEFAQEELVTLRDGRLVLPIKSEYKRLVPGFIHSSSATGQTVYIEPTETLELNNEIRDLEFEEQREVARILTDLTDRIRPHIQDLLQSLTIIAELDSLTARALYGRDVAGASPRLAHDRQLRIVQGRHPLLLLHKPAADVVPLDFALGDGTSTIIITGPNAGGKSVAMKTVGLLALMVQSGIPVPCSEESVFPVYTGLYVDIGDEQSVENDLSTFSSHIQRLTRIVRDADSRSLVLIDEIGTGTDPAEGSALGASILETLAAVSAHVVVTTHHGMLKAFAHEHPRMMNAAMAFDITTLQPTYRFRAGLPGSSYAFEITRRHGMDARIIERARDLLGTRGDALEQLLSDLDHRLRDLAEQVAAATKERAGQERLASELRQRLDALNAETKALRRKALDDAAAVLSDANAIIERSVKEIRETQASREAIRTAKEAVTAAQDATRAERAALSDQPQPAGPGARKPLRQGDSVVMADNPSAVGVVLEAERDGHVAVAFGAMKMRLACDAVTRTEQPRSSSPTMTHTQEEPPKSSIDVRGMYGDEAEKTVDTYLVEAYSAGFKRVDIIHGKGTGALRKRMHEFLRDCPLVDSYRLGEWNEGMTGVTVVTLKS